MLNGFANLFPSSRFKNAEELGVTVINQHYAVCRHTHSLRVQHFGTHPLEERVASVFVLLYQQRRQYWYFCTSQNLEFRRRNRAALVRIHRQPAVVHHQKVLVPQLHVVDCVLKVENVGRVEVLEQVYAALQTGFDNLVSVRKHI